MNTTVARKEDNSIELTITIPWATIDAAYNQVIDDYTKEAELPGFRKGKAPRTMVEERIDRTKAYEEVLKRVIPKLYADAVEQEKIKPVIMPKIDLKEAAENKDWTVIATTAERPTVELGEYKKAVTEVKAGKAKKIWVPGKDEKPETEKDNKPTMDEILTAVLSSVKAVIPEILIEQEVNRQLSELIDQTKKLGLTVEQYLASTGRTAQALKGELTEQARKTITLEFAMEGIADTEGILVSDDDIDAVLKTAKSEEERKAMEDQRYYLASVLRRQKTLDYLASL